MTGHQQRRGNVSAAARCTVCHVPLRRPSPAVAPPLVVSVSTAGGGRCVARVSAGGGAAVCRRRSVPHGGGPARRAVLAGMAAHLTATRLPSIPADGGGGGGLTGLWSAPDDANLRHRDAKVRPAAQLPTYDKG